MSGDEFDKRVKDRMTEIAAVQHTIKILNSDKAFDSFDKTVGAVLLQTGATSREKEGKLLQLAGSVLRRAADTTGAVQLAALANSAHLDAFVKVK